MRDKKLIVVGDNNAEILDSIESEYEVVTSVTANDAVYFVTSQDTNIRKAFLDQIDSFDGEVTAIIDKDLNPNSWT